MHKVSDEEFLKTTVSYDGAYQQRPTKFGGGYAHYCFAAVISVETGKVLKYDIACNSCRLCVEKQQALRDKRISPEMFNLWLGEHRESCQAEWTMGRWVMGHGSDGSRKSMGHMGHGSRLRDP